MENIEYIKDLDCLHFVVNQLTIENRQLIKNNKSLEKERDELIELIPQFLKDEYIKNKLYNN